MTWASGLSVLLYTYRASGTDIFKCYNFAESKEIRDGLSLDIATLPRS